MSRLQDSIYRPPHVFEDLNWPGDFIGRTILGLTMDARALHVQSSLLRELIDSLPLKLNSKGYMGPDYHPSINEQQLSGHGWLLRGLCEYYKWTGDRSVVPVMKSVSDNLFVSGLGRYASYPVVPEQRNSAAGGASGTISGEKDSWMLSTDIGCLFIGMAGLIDYYELFPDRKVRAAIDEMVAKFLEMDIVAVKAQTHATLSALRSLIKYSRITGENSLMDEVVRRWDIYVAEGMTCCFANYNWFGRRDTWTEPCAIVDSYIVAFELWRETMNPSYRDMAELICTNALWHAQRSNGGFGCDSCPSADNPCLKISIPEAYWCCTMRGAEGLARVAESLWAVKGNELYVPFYENSRFCADGFEIVQESLYPEEGKVSFEFVENRTIDRLLVPDLKWVTDTRIMLDGKDVVPVKENGFICIEEKFLPGDKVEVSFDIPVRTDTVQNCVRVFRGPVQLGEREGNKGLEPVPSLMRHFDSDCIRVLFPSDTRKSTKKIKESESFQNNFCGKCRE